MDRINPQLASGFKDWLPRDAASRQLIIDKIKMVFERFGFCPIDTPALEKEEILTGGDPDFAKQIYRAKITDSDEPLALRFDLTVPLARFVAAHTSSLQFPLARYQIGNVWRGEHAQAGRYRQFIQCDADFVGSKSILADAQIIALIYNLFSELGLGERLQIKISDRRILGSLSSYLNFPASKTSWLLRAIDKLDKQGWTVVADELKKNLGFDSQQLDSIQELLDLNGQPTDSLLNQLDRMFEFVPEAKLGLASLKELTATLDNLGLPSSVWSLDLSIARGLNYYTGLVFETSLSGLVKFGSVCSGGRYDDLVSRFSPIKLSGVGLSVGLDRLFAALDDVGLVPPAQNQAQVAVLDFTPESRSDLLKLTTTLRQASIDTTFYIGSEETLKGQLAWALKSSFHYVIIKGATEKASGTVQLKDLLLRQQDEISDQDLIKILKLKLSR